MSRIAAFPLYCGWLLYGCPGTTGPDTPAPAGAAPSVTVDAPPTAFLGEPVAVTAVASDPDGDVPTITWTVDGAAVGDGNTLTLSDLAMGPHTIVATATDGAGLTGTDTAETDITLRAPTDVVVDRTTSESLVVAWTPTTGADRHDVLLATEPGIDPARPNALPNALVVEDATSPVRIPELVDSADYHLVVVGVRDGIAGQPTEELAVGLTCAPGECTCVEAAASTALDVFDTCGGYTDRVDAPDLPRVALDEWNYATLFSGVGYGLPFDGTSQFQDLGEGRACGACLEIAGPDGAITAIVSSIADVDAVGDMGLPHGVILESADAPMVRPSLGEAVDVTVRPVSCPLQGDMELELTVFSSELAGTEWLALYYRVYNHVDPIVSVEIKAETGHDQWYPLTPGWSGLWVGNPDVTNPQIPIPDPPNGPVRFRLTTLYGEVVESQPVQQPDRPIAGATGTTVHAFDLGVQFTGRTHLPGQCTVDTVTSTCGNRRIDDGEDCDWAAGEDFLDCALFNLGTGIVGCDPLTCTWDASTCQ